MEHDRFRRLLILDAVFDRDDDDDADDEEDRVPRMSEREHEEADRAELEEMCDRFDALHAEARQKLWDLLKIPIAPATIIATGLEVGVAFGLLQKEIGHVAVVLDIAWATYKVAQGILGRSTAIAGKETAIIRIQAFLHTQSERAAMMHRAIIDAHEPELRESLMERGSY